MVGLDVASRSAAVCPALSRDTVEDLPQWAEGDPGSPSRPPGGKRQGLAVSVCISPMRSEGAMDACSAVTNDHGSLA